jgi:3(or 17)beta-hydroxysteroid dehydrogenase
MVQALVREGARVAATDVDEAGGRALEAELGPACAFLAHDVRDEGAWRRVVAETLARFGRLDLLVNNAGVNAVGTIEDASLEQWRALFAVNADGAFLGCKHALAALRASGAGSIVNVSSIAAMVGRPAFVAYGASKGAVRSLTKAVAVHCTSLGYPVRCNSIHPGAFDTPMLDRLRDHPEEASPLARRLFSPAPRELLGRPEDVAELVLYLASDASRLVNGAELVIDGGAIAS